jgi:hypothetical protein
MRLLSDFFIATKEEVHAFDFWKSPVLCFPTVMGRGVDGGAEWQLEGIVAGLYWERPEVWESARMEWTRRESYPAIVNVTRFIVDMLAEADEPVLEAWAEAWALTTEWIHDGVTPERTREITMGLGRLARQARRSGREMYLWLCEEPPEQAAEEMSHF